jgi:hypothetical protein
MRDKNSGAIRKEIREFWRSVRSVSFNPPRKKKKNPPTHPLQNELKIKFGNVY